MKKKSETLLVALGGNALIRKGQTGSIEEQFENLKIPIRQIVRLSRKYRIIITHGNGPQVGGLLLQQECCHDLPRMPLEILVAQTQGQIGYMIESTLDNELMSLGLSIRQSFVSILSYVVVDPEDPSFANPTKPVGPFFTEEESLTLPYPCVKTPKGYRRVVVSPRPVSIVERKEIRKLIDMDFIVICCGGGGIPVIRENRTFSGVDAVIDKDLASAKLAEEVGVDIFIIASDVSGAAIHFGTEKEEYLRNADVREMRKYADAGHFPAGSMGPKVEAATAFIRKGGRRAVICSVGEIEEALAGNAGTEIVS